MKNQKCLHCPQHQLCKENHISWIFFVIGMVATIAIRAVTLLGYIRPLYGQIAWYVGVLGFLIFFLYKFKVDQARATLVKEKNLLDTLLEKDTIDKENRILIASLLCALSSNKDRINYLLIFVSSAIALIIALYFDFLR